MPYLRGEAALYAPQKHRKCRKKRRQQFLALIARALSTLLLRQLRRSWPCVRPWFSKEGQHHSGSLPSFKERARPPFPLADVPARTTPPRLSEVPDQILYGAKPESHRSRPVTYEKPVSPRLYLHTSIFTLVSSQPCFSLVLLSPFLTYKPSLPQRYRCGDTGLKILARRYWCEDIGVGILVWGCGCEDTGVNILV